MESLTNSKYWDKEWKIIKSNKKLLFLDIFGAYLKKDKNLDCLEIGCIPGRFLAYFNKEFGYKIYGIDFANLSSTKKFFKEEGIKNYKLYKQDFTKFKSKKKFDFVCSFGFIEHFDDYDKIFKKHVDLSKKKGTIIIEMPNFRYGQYYLHKIFDRKNLEIHNIQIMDLNIIRKLCEKYKLEPLYLNYYKTAGFWMSGADKHNILLRFFGLSTAFFLKLINIAINFPTRYFSPYIILVAKKK